MDAILVLLDVELVILSQQGMRRLLAANAKAILHREYLDAIGTTCDKQEFPILCKLEAVVSTFLNKGCARENSVGSRSLMHEIIDAPLGFDFLDSAACFSASGNIHLVVENPDGPGGEVVLENVHGRVASVGNITDSVGGIAVDPFSNHPVTVAVDGDGAADASGITGNSIEGIGDPGRGVKRL